MQVLTTAPSPLPTGKIEDDLAAVQAQRDMLRAKRREGDRRPVVAIVGYTNAGKSTLLNTLCGSSEVYADDLLFATLDPTSRLHALPGGKEVLLTDTVGFIQKLPTKLVAAFRATLDELVDATLLVHVVDASSEIAVQQVRSVQGARARHSQPRSHARAHNGAPIPSPQVRSCTALTASLACTCSQRRPDPFPTGALCPGHRQRARGERQATDPRAQQG
jgi:tRNA U34 5-carboxymethylaminomethyl modifying GTPase MnmE/TrmE